MKTIQFRFLILLYVSITLPNSSCLGEPSLKIVWVNFKNTFVNGEPIALSYYVENVSKNLIHICEPTQQARTIKYNMDLSYFDLIMRYRESCKRNNQILNLDTIPNISNFAKELNQTSHEDLTNLDTLFERSKQALCSERTAYKLYPGERKYFQSIIYNEGIGLNSKRYVENELVAGNYILKVRIANVSQGYFDDSFVFSIYDRSTSQELEYKTLHNIFHQHWKRFNVGENNPTAIGKSIEDFIIQYPTSIFIEKAFTLMADNGMKDGSKDFIALNEKFVRNINNDALLFYISWLASKYVVEYDYINSNTEKFELKFHISKYQYFDMMLKNCKNKSPEISDFLLSAIKYHNRFYQKKISGNQRAVNHPDDYDNLVNYARQTGRNK